jgi:hypothetical protein
VNVSAAFQGSRHCGHRPDELRHRSGCRGGRSRHGRGGRPTAPDFDLTTTISRDHIDECRTYTITIAAAGLRTYTVNTQGFSGNKEGNEHRQVFSISQPSPTIMSGC